MLGSGAVIVLDDTRCMVKSLLRLSYFYFEESCGQCTPCREGTGWLWRMVDRIEHGAGRPEDLDVLTSVADNIAGPHDLRAGRRRGVAGQELHQAFPRASSSTTSSTSAAWCRLVRMSSCAAAQHRDRRPRRAGAARQHGDGCREQARHLRSAFLLSQEAVDRRQLPDVPRAGREGAQAAARVRDAGHRRHEGRGRIRSRRSRRSRA